MRRLAIGGLVLSFATPAATEEPAPPLPAVALPPALGRVLRDYERAWQGRDAEALAELFAEDGFVLASFRPPVRGRDAIRAAYGSAGGGLALRALAYATEGSVGYIVGAFGRAPGAEDSGKFVLALKRVGDRWLIAADIDNSSRPQRAAPTTTPAPATPP